MRNSRKNHLIPIIISIMITFCNCARPPIVQTAMVLDRRGGSISNTFAKHNNNSTVAFKNGDKISGNSGGNVSIIDLEGRWGLGKKFELGARFGSGGIGLDLKYQFIEEIEYLPSFAADIGAGLWYAYLSGILSRDFSIKNWVVTPLVNINYKYITNGYWLNLPEKYRTEEGSPEFTGVAEWILENGMLLEIPAGIQIAYSRSCRSSLALIFAVAPQIYFWRDIVDFECINCDQKMESFRHNTDILYILQMRYIVE